MTIERMRQLLDVERNIGKANEIISDNLIVLCRVLEQETKEQIQQPRFLPKEETTIDKVAGWAKPYNGISNHDAPTQT